MSIERETPVTFVCPSCGRKHPAMPELWREFWETHDRSLAMSPAWKEAARQWFAARGHPDEPLNPDFVCSGCAASSAMERWLTQP